VWPRAVQPRENELPRARLFQFSGLQIYGEANVGTIWRWTERRSLSI
jgi:hypothetical protein